MATSRGGNMAIRFATLFAAVFFVAGLVEAAEETPLLAQSPTLGRTDVVFACEALKKNPVVIPAHPPYPNYHKK
jgi:hypothetical protein